MPTFVGNITNNQIVFLSAVSIPGNTTSLPKSYQSLLDTGAQGTMISSKVVSQIGLTSIGDKYITPVNGQPVRCDKFRIRLDIPISSGVVLPTGGMKGETILRGKDMDVAELPYQPSNFDVLLGMDFLASFHLTIYQQSFILST